MDDVFEMSLLLDFYGQMLTPKQYELMDLYYNNDFSLAEISEELEITRQGVHDGIKKAKTSLHSIEDKLGLVGRFMEQRKRAKEAIEIIDSLETIAGSEKEILKLKECVESMYNLE